MKNKEYSVFKKGLPFAFVVLYQLAVCLNHLNYHVGEIHLGGVSPEKQPIELSHLEIFAKPQKIVKKIVKKVENAMKKKIISKLSSMREIQFSLMAICWKIFNFIKI